MNRFLEAQAAADRAQEKLEDAEQHGLSSKAIEELTAERDRLREYADKGVLDRINAETVEKRAEQRERRERSKIRRRERRERFYRERNPDRYRAMHASLKGDTLTISLNPFDGSTAEQPPKWFARRMRPQGSTRRKSSTTKRKRGSRRRSSRSSRGSPDDGPGEPEPEGGLADAIEGAIPCFVLVIPDCEADHG
jgi:hypothetical protein